MTAGTEKICAALIAACLLSTVSCSSSEDLSPQPDENISLSLKTINDKKISPATVSGSDDGITTVHKKTVSITSIKEKKRSPFSEENSASAYAAEETDDNEDRVFDYDETEELSPTSRVAPASATKNCKLSWKPNREKGVNCPGGGYRIYYSRDKHCTPEKALSMTVTYESGPLSPTEAELRLEPGTWHIRIAGFSPYNGGTEGLLSDPVTITVKD
ncbi:MAG TPA: hypothetical protein PK926_12735 [Spirochaetota bacterium]|nr:hypothetical protein [Spirochaetota bacterium]HPI89904.1 hypothetical protein [Spirochaetota bacterium]HPR49076.1 hypothetical protein [Spirochaetota bacterium]